MKLYVCWTTAGNGSHPCTAAHRALKDAGHDPQVVRAYGWRVLPDVPFNLTPGRRRAKALTGTNDVPVLELPDGSAIGGSQEIAAWARANPAMA
jgi:hypothetical protein